MRTLLAVLVVAASAALPARGATGAVSYVTTARAYLDLGARDGLVAGQVLELRRGGKAAGTCRVDVVAGHRATCIGADVRPGDGFVVTEPARVPETTTQPPRPSSPTQLVSRREALVRFEQPLVPYRGGEAGTSRLRGRGEATFTHGMWDVSAERGFQSERADITIAGLELWNGVRLHARLSATAWTQRPGTARQLPGGSTQLWVRELALASREPGRGLMLAAGRVWPWHVPGVAMFDGVQAGWRSGGFEAGAFGGLVPEPLSLAPSSDRWLAGAYYAYERARDGDSILRYFRHEARVGTVTVPSAASRLEAQLLANAWFSRSVGLGGEVRAALDGGRASLDLAVADVVVRAADTVRVTGTMRYQAARTATAGEPLLVELDGASRHASLQAAWTVRPWLSLGLTGGSAESLDAGLRRGFAGPEVGLPQLFGTRGGVSVGYVEELGWSAGRNGWFQATVLPADWLDVFARVSYYADPSSAGWVAHEVGTFVSAGVRLLPWLGLRLNGLVRAGVPVSEDAGVPAGYAVSASLKARY